MATALPSGTITFVFTDIEGSTKLGLALGTERYHQVLEVHTRALRDAFADGGTEVRIEGDALFVVFPSAVKAVRAAAAGQRALAAAAFPHGATVRVRMGMHTGDGAVGSAEAGADYVGIDVVRAARIAAVAHGGQVLASGATVALVRQDLPAGVSLRDLGEHRLKDLAQPELIQQLVIDGLPSDFPPIRTLDRMPNNLPTQVTTFIGREAEIAEGLRLLGATRLLTLTGPGGTGKTRLSLQLAVEAAESFPDGAFWVPLAPISDPELVPSTIAHSLGVQVSGSESPLQRVTEHVRGKQMLLVLDNMEQILPAAASVAALLAAGSQLKILASSRAPLHISGEQEFPVPPLELPDHLRLPSLDVLAQSDAVRLFIERAMAVKPDFRITAENASAVAEIVFHLEGLPLAIELAAARVKLLTPQAMVPRLKKGLDLLASASADRTDRQRTLRGAIAWSYDLLDDGIKRLFARCAVFVGGAMLPQLEAVCGPADDVGRAVLDGVSELFDQSLLRRQEVDGEPRFRMLVTIRDYALEKLESSSEADAIHRRHANAYIALAEDSAPHLQGTDQKRWLDVLELEHDNFRAALDCAIEGQRTEDASRLAFALWRFWQVRGHLREGLVWAERTLALPSADPSVRARALEAAGGIAYWLADVERAKRFYGEANEIAKRDGRAAERALAAYNYSFAFMVLAREPAVGIPLLEESLAAYREVGDPAGIGRAAWALGQAYVLGDATRDALLRGRDYVREAYKQHRALGNQFDIGWDLHGIGLAAFKLGDHDEAERSWTEATRIFADADDASGLLLMFSNLGELAKARGDLERHDTLVGAWTAIAERTGVGLAGTLGNTEGRLVASEIPLDRQPAMQRGRAMQPDAALAYALGTRSAKP
ncbi:MAG TPA: adenylate/guanylate cyclase domain-containing protein [Candidatus Limnocylindria bacterium]|nr:adenylate/guanylate cyclase domain-containing protein [Candidatus Limnocylindria bacterium]